MKVELILTAPQLAYLATSFDSFCEHYKPKWSTLPQKDKATYTIIQDVADKLTTKVRTLGRKANPKPSKMTFKYHEAHAINAYLLLAKDTYKDDYIKSLAINIFSQIDQKLT